MILLPHKVNSLLTRAPLLSAFICCSAGIAGGLYWLAVLACLAYLASLRLWRQLLFALLCSFLGATLSAQQAKILLNAPAHFQEMMMSSEACVKGSIMRSFNKSVWLELDQGYYRIELRPQMERMPQRGERYAVSGVPAFFQDKVYPGSFDRAKWCEENGVAFYVPKPRMEYLGEGSWKSLVLASSERCRGAIARVLLEGSSEDDPRSHVLISLLLGDKSYADAETIDLFRCSGSLHAFAVSGLHVGIISLMLLGVFRMVRLRHDVASMLIILLLGVYVFATGLSVSALRAYIMISLLLFGSILRRPVSTANIWSLTGLVLILIDPRSLFQAGFQLSFVIFGVICMGVHYLKQSPNWWAPHAFIPENLYSPRQKYMLLGLSKLRLVCLVSLLAWFVSLPLTAYHFGTMNMYSVLTNVAITPFLPLIMGCSLLSCVCAWSTSLVLFFNEIARYLAACLLFIVECVCGIPHAMIPAQFPAESSTALIFTYPYDSYSASFGNPAFLVDVGKKEDFSFALLPSLTQLSIQPKALMMSHPAAVKSEGVLACRARFPELELISQPSRVWQASPDSTFSFYPAPPCPYKRRADDAVTIIRWDYKSTSLLYVGNAPLRHIYALPAAVRAVDIIVLGKNAYDPSDELSWLRQASPKHLLLKGESLLSEQLLPKTKVHLLPKTGVSRINMETLSIERIK